MTRYIRVGPDRRPGSTPVKGLWPGPSRASVTPDGPRPQSILDLVGNTPVVPLRRVTQGLPYTVLAKLEYLNPGGSVKDRIGAAMVDDAERRGLLKPGGTIVEATSGNTGVGLALVAAVRGYRVVFVLPDKMSTEKIRLLRAYGARVVVTPSGLAPDHPMSHYSVARRLALEIPGACYPNQYENQANPDAHYPDHRARDRSGWRPRARCRHRHGRYGGHLERGGAVLQGAPAGRADRRGRSRGLPPRAVLPDSLLWARRRRTRSRELERT